MDDLEAFLTARFDEAVRQTPEPGTAHITFIEDPHGGCMVELTAPDGTRHYGFDGSRS